MIEGVLTNGHGELDMGADRETREPKPCSRRLNIRVDDEVRVTWCVLEDGHDGGCSGPFPRQMAKSDFMPKSKAHGQSTT